MFKYLETLMPSKKNTQNITTRRSGAGSSASKVSVNVSTKASAKKSGASKKKASAKRSAKSGSGKVAKKTTRAAGRTSAKKTSTTKSKTGGTKTARKVAVNTKTKSTSRAAASKKIGGARKKKATASFRSSQKSRTNAKGNEVHKLTLVHAGDDTSFWVNQGPVLKNLKDLEDALELISEEQYEHHARDKEDNDFARWVNEVLCDGECAREIGKAHDRKKAKDAVRTRLRVYEI
jgi:hypothetical protein